MRKEIENDRRVNSYGYAISVQKWPKVDKQKERRHRIHGNSQEDLHRLPKKKKESIYQHSKEGAV